MIIAAGRTGKEIEMDNRTLSERETAFAIAEADRAGVEPDPQVIAAFDGLGIIERECVAWFAAGARWGADHALIRLPERDDSPFITRARRAEAALERFSQRLDRAIDALCGRVDGAQ